MTHGSDLLSLGAVSTLALLPVYHRFYDAALLVVPLCWCMTHVKGRPGRTDKNCITAYVPFLVPGAAFLQQLSNKRPCAGGGCPFVVVELHCDVA